MIDDSETAIDGPAPRRAATHGGLTGHAWLGGGPVPKPEFLIVDAANVIGSRPDGWWRDRPAAVQRLMTALVRGLRGHDEIIVVLEGAARAGVEPGVADGIKVVHASGSADDEIVRIVGAAAAEKDRPITVVTADRELRDRVIALGARVIGPGSFWERLDGVS